jgi:ferric-dicitrate binding protein FerR (iron transport regulator)
MSDIRNPNAEGGDRDLEDLIVTHLATQSLDPEALDRVRAAVREAWETAAGPTARPKSGRFGPRSRWWAGLAAAGVLAVVIGLFFGMHPAAQGEMIGSLADARGGTLEVAGRFIGHRTVAGGNAIRVGDAFTARAAALILLTQGGTLRVAAGSVIVVAAASKLQLERGTLYVDKPVGLPTAARLRVATRAGLVEHVGTEFEVFSDDQIVRIRVREGEVRFSGALGVQLAAVGTQLVATSDGQVTRQAIPTYGRDWQWTAALAPEFAVEGRSLEDYLQWISRELGRPIVFADARARERAQRTILHGAIHSPATLDALDEILSSTSLSYELADGVIRVHSGQ